MPEVGILFHLFSFLLALLAAVLLVWVNKEQEYSNRLLAGFLAICSLINLNDAILYGGWFMKIPLFHKIALPFSLLVAPLSYLYVRSALLGELKFRRNDWLLLIPFVLYAINLMPYYLMPIEKKRAYLTQFYNSVEFQGLFNEGILPPYLFIFLRVGWSSVFIMLNFQLIRRFKKNTLGKTLVQNREMLNWLSTFNWLNTIILLSSLAGAFLATTYKVNLYAPDVVLGIVVTVMCFKLFLMPKLLYGIYLPSEVVIHIADQLSDHTGEPVSRIVEREYPETSAADLKDSQGGLAISPANSIRYKTILETFFQQQKPFLDVDYSLEKLVSDVNINRHTLSSFINKEYGIGFREYLNRYRVKFIVENRFNPEWQLLTLEAIGAQAGFKNRTTFMRQFKSIMGVTASAYFKNTKEGQHDTPEHSLLDPE
jgi:AraC-like DNA-binding protein